MGFLGDVLKVAAPVAGFALGGPAGAMLGSAVAGGVSGAQKDAKANKMSQQAQNIAMGNWNQTAPLRSRALEMAMAPRAQREDTSALFADPGNPYSRVVSRPSADLSRVAGPVAPAEASSPSPTGQGHLMGVARMLGGGAPPASREALDRAVGGGSFASSHPLIQRVVAASKGPRIGPDGLVRAEQ